MDLSWTHHGPLMDPSGTLMFRSPSDRKQIDIRAEQVFAKERSRFMDAYHRETAKPYGYIMMDSHPQTASEKNKS